MRIKTGINPFYGSGRDSDGQSFGALSRRRSFEFDSFSEPNSSNGKISRESVVTPKKIMFWTAALFIGLSILGVRAVYLQLIMGSHYRAVADGNRIRIVDIKATRGIIYDRTHKQLVTNIPGFSLALIPVDLPKDQFVKGNLFDEIARISGKNWDEISSILADQSSFSYQPIDVADNLTQDQAIMAKILSSKYSGVILQSNNIRHYLMSTSTPSLSHILGYEGKIEPPKLNDYLAKGYVYDDYIGKAGLELSYEKELKGANGREQVEVDALGQAKDILASQKAVDGDNLLLAIDADLQRTAENSLNKALQLTHAKKGVVIILDPNNGEILAMVSLPAYDNNLFTQGISQTDFSALINNPNQPMFTRAISGQYPSGSTFKMVVGAAALQEGLITENTTVNSVGGIRVNVWYFPDWKAGGHGITNIIKALAESVNTFFYTIGGGFGDIKGLGVEQIKKYAEMFGLNKKLGIDLPEEASGFVPSIDWKEEVKNEAWYIGDTYHLAIGQGDLLVTPLQVTCYTSVIANNGTLYQPHIVKEILDSDNNIINNITPNILNQNFIDQKNIKIIQKGLRQAVLTGSAKGLGGLPVSVAAKTGTAQWFGAANPQAWITAYAPYEKPQIVVTILIEQGGEGSTAAMPVARDIISWWAENRNGT